MHSFIQPVTKATILLASSSPSSYSHFYLGWMYDDIHLHVAWSYTSSADICCEPFIQVCQSELQNLEKLLS